MNQKEKAQHLDAIEDRLIRTLINSRIPVKDATKGIRQVRGLIEKALNDATESARKESVTS